MSIRTMCEKCGKVVRYTDDKVQEYQAMTNPQQFCECEGDDEKIMPAGG